MVTRADNLEVSDRPIVSNLCKCAWVTSDYVTVHKLDALHRCYDDHNNTKQVTSRTGGNKAYAVVAFMISFLLLSI